MSPKDASLHVIDIQSIWHKNSKQLSIRVLFELGRYHFRIVRPQLLHMRAQIGEHTMAPLNSTPVTFFITAAAY